MAGKRRVASTQKITASDTRLSLGRAREEARFTAAPTLAEMPAAYLSTLNEIKKRLQQARLRTVLAANAGLVMAYWEIGRIILTRQAAQGWGAKVIDRLSIDLRQAFPDMTGLSPRNLKYMRAFAAAWPDAAIVQRVVAQLPWRQNVALLDKLSDPAARIWYAENAVRHGWSQHILCHQIDSRLRERQGKAVNSFQQTLPPVESDLAVQIFKDPICLTFSAPPRPAPNANWSRRLWITSRNFCWAMENNGDWPVVPLDEIANEITVGFVGPMSTEYVVTGIPFLRSLNIDPYRINCADLKYISASFDSRISKSRLNPGDVVIVRTGKPGTAAVVPEWLTKANCSDLVIVRPGPRLSAHFLVYFVNSVAQHHICAHSVGAVQQHFNVGSAKEMTIPLPTLSEQRAIARVLGVLDDKIELNRRMNHTLEALARSIFKSWFVDFDPVVSKAGPCTIRNSCAN